MGPQNKKNIGGGKDIDHRKIESKMESRLKLIKVIAEYTQTSKSLNEIAADNKMEVNQLKKALLDSDAFLDREIIEKISASFDPKTRISEFGPIELDSTLRMVFNPDTQKRILDKEFPEENFDLTQIEEIMYLIQELGFSEAEVAKRLKHLSDQKIKKIHDFLTEFSLKQRTFQLIEKKTGIGEGELEYLAKLWDEYSRKKIQNLDTKRNDILKRLEDPSVKVKVEKLISSAISKGRINDIIAPLEEILEGNK